MRKWCGREVGLCYS